MIPPEDQGLVADNEGCNNTQDNDSTPHETDTVGTPIQNDTDGPPPTGALKVLPGGSGGNGSGQPLPNPLNNAPTPLSAESLRISQDFAGMVGVERVLTTVPIRKPNRFDWFRVHPEWVLSPVALIELKDEHETYVLTPEAAASALGEYNLYSLFPTINRQGVVLLWPVRLPGADGRSNRWHEAAHDAALRGRDAWTRMTANMNLGAYDIFRARAEIPDPVWPDTSLDELVEIAFRGQVISDAQHPVLRRLRGEL